MERRMEQRQRRRRNEAGLTLIEMLVVVTIIVMFAALVGPNLFKQTDKARVATCKTQIQNFEVAIAGYKLATGVFPTTDQGLQALLVKPAGVNNWDGPYLKKEIPLDQWGRPFVYKYPGDHGDEPDILSFGPDGQQGTADDVMSWK
jgi:general secretion pathway protein G